MRILIAGAAGYIGSHVMKLGYLRDHDMVGFDNFNSTLYPGNLKRLNADRVARETGLEILDFDPLLQPWPRSEFGVFDAVINEMAIPGLLPSWEQFDAYLDSNVLALKILLDNVLEDNPRVRFVQASTSSVYGNTDGTQSINPISPYGVSKLAAENLLSVYEKEGGLNLGVLRYFSVFGELQRPDMAYSKFIRCISNNEEIHIFGDGNQTRTNTYVGDVAEATLRAATSRDSFTLDISGYEEITLLEAVEVIAEEIGRVPRVKFFPRRPGDQHVTKGNLERAKTKLDWFPELSFVEGIRTQITQTLGQQ